MDARTAILGMKSYLRHENYFKAPLPWKEVAPVKTTERLSIFFVFGLLE